MSKCRPVSTPYSTLLQYPAFVHLHHSARPCLPARAAHIGMFLADLFASGEMSQFAHLLTSGSIVVSCCAAKLSNSSLTPPARGPLLRERRDPVLVSRNRQHEANNGDNSRILAAKSHVRSLPWSIQVILISRRSERLLRQDTQSLLRHPLNVWVVSIGHLVAAGSARKPTSPHLLDARASVFPGLASTRRVCKACCCHISHLIV